MSRKAPKYRVFMSNRVWTATTFEHEGSKSVKYTQTGPTPIAALTALIEQENKDRKEINDAFSQVGISL